MELETVIKEIELRDASIKQRLDLLEKGRTEDLEDRLNDLQSNIDSLKALLHHMDFKGHDGCYAGGFGNERQAKGFGLWVMAALGGQTKMWDALSGLGYGVKALSEGVNADGGALVPTEFKRDLIRLVAKYGKFRQGALNVPLSSDKSVWPKLASDVTVYLPGEANAITASSPTFSNVTLVAEKLAALCAISSELEEDSAVAVGEIVADSIARSFARAEDQIAFLGNGTSTYYGMTGITGALMAVDATIGNIASIVVGSGNAYSELLLSDFDQVCATLPSEYDDGAKWYMSKYFFWTVCVPLIGAYSSGAPTIGSPADYAAGPRPIFRGYPVEFVNVMPKVAANSQICAILGDLRAGAFFGERRALRIDRSRDVYFTTDQIGIRGTERIAVNTFGVGDTTNAGPICALATAAA